MLSLETVLLGFTGSYIFSVFFSYFVFGYLGFSIFSVNIGVKVRVDVMLKHRVKVKVKVMGRVKVESKFEIKVRVTVRVRTKFKVKVNPKSMQRSCGPTNSPFPLCRTC